MIPRRDQAHVTALLQQFPAVVLLGPRQVGKTTLAHAVLDAVRTPGTYLDLEQPAQRAVLEADPEPFLRAQEGRLVVLDEVQRLPDLFAILRGAIDRRRRQGERVGHFLLLGSASHTLLRQPAESLAGRAVYHELAPLMTTELPAASTAAGTQLWLRGGFPESFLSVDDTASLRWRQSFVQAYLERDIPALGSRLPATTLRRLWTMLAHVQGGLFQAARIATSLGVSGHTVARYLDVLVDLMLVRRLPPWAGNVGKRLVRAPKVYVRDSGVAHALLGLRQLEDLLSHPVAGTSWEGFVVEHLVAHAGPLVAATFYRTAAGAELDLVLEAPGQVRWAVEIKRTSTPTASRGFRLACDDLQVARRLIVHGGEMTYSLGDGITAMTLGDACAAVAALAA